MRLSTFGQLELRNGDELQLPRRRKELVLLAILAQRAPAAVPRSELAALLWDNRDAARARHSLRQALSELHRVLGDALRLTASDATLAPGAVALDAAEFLAACTREDWDAAVELWRGEFLPDTDGVGGAALAHWRDATRSELRAALSTACERRCLEAERQGRWARAVSHAETWFRHAPGNEAARSRLAA